MPLIRNQHGDSEPGDNRAFRRHLWSRAKQRAARLWARWHKPDAHGEYRYIQGPYTATDLARDIAHLAETHGRPCSCAGCKRGAAIPPPRVRAALADDIFDTPSDKEKA